MMDILLFTGKWLGVPTPKTEQLIKWGQKQIKKEYLVDGELSGKDKTEYDLYGITLDELIKECVTMGAALTKMKVNTKG